MSSAEPNGETLAVPVRPEWKMEPRCSTPSTPGAPMASQLGIVRSTSSTPTTQSYTVAPVARPGGSGALVVVARAAQGRASPLTVSSE